MEDAGTGAIDVADIDVDVTSCAQDYVKDEISHRQVSCVVLVSSLIKPSVKLAFYTVFSYKDYWYLQVS